MNIVHVIERGATTYTFTIPVDDLGCPSDFFIKVIPSRNPEMENLLDFLSWTIGLLFRTRAPLPTRISSLVLPDGDPDATAEVRSVLEEVFDIIRADLSHLPQAS